MNIVLIHIGGSLPEHFWVCLEQARRYFIGKIHVVIPKACLDDKRFDLLCVTKTSWETLSEDILYKEFEKACFLTGFWNVTMGRLFLLEVLMRKHKLQEIVHIENDVLIYKNPSDMADAFRSQANDSVLMTPIGPDYIAAAYCFVPHIEAIAKVNTVMKGLLVMGEDLLKRRTSGQPVNEMTLLAFIMKEYGGVVKCLPIRPAGKCSAGITPFNSVFDPATIGQHLDGIPSDPGVPLYDTEKHYIAPDLKSGAYKIDFVDGIPWMVLGGKRWRVNNIHCHSKRLERFANA